MSTQPPKVFISYSQDDAEHRARVLDLADRLRIDGVDCELDQYYRSPPEGWPRWMDRSIEQADYILVVCTETYNKRCTGREKPGRGLGVRWESVIIYQHLYDAESLNTKFIPILYDDDDKQWIPKPLGGATHYRLPAEEQYEELLDHLFGIPPTEKPILGEVPKATASGARMSYEPVNAVHVPSACFEDDEAFDVFLSHSYLDAVAVRELACRLEDEAGFRVWLDKWVLKAGKSWQQEIVRGIENAAACAVCIGAESPQRWFANEIELALSKQAQRPTSFAVIPVLLQGANKQNVPALLHLRTWADFRKGHDSAYAFHVLCQGIRGLPIGRWPIPSRSAETSEIWCQRKLRSLERLRKYGLRENILIDGQRKIVDRLIEDETM
ncbi:MAG: toll/interleukin-1 receptor domain-containing protein [Phycisphaerae bacterium]|nr:toll/interleukin-1 receptor domain-containing protein [Phycisphaerae bacterium]